MVTCFQYVWKTTKRKLSTLIGLLSIHLSNTTPHDEVTAIYLLHSPTEKTLMNYMRYSPSHSNNQTLTGSKFQQILFLHYQYHPIHLDPLNFILIGPDFTFYTYFRLSAIWEVSHVHSKRAVRFTWKLTPLWEQFRCIFQLPSCHATSVRKSWK